MPTRPPKSKRTKVALEGPSEQDKFAIEEAATALRVAHELEEDGDPEMARRAVEHAVRTARDAAAKSVLCFDESERVLTEDAPPAALIVSVGLSTLGGLSRSEDDLASARSAFEESLVIWPGNATALCRLADLELQHGSFRRAQQLYKACAASPPCAATANGTWHAELVTTPRSEAVALASYMLALLLQLAGCCDEALPYLRRLGVRHRLSPALWGAIATRRLQGAAARPLKSDAEVARYSGAVPPSLLRQLQAAFALHSPFWKETGYKERGYYSFWYDTTRPPSNAVEALAQLLLPLTGHAGDVVGCEWWVHGKTATRALGHQMHFDTEEGTLHAHGEVLHPAVSCVLYLSGARCRHVL